MRCEAWLCIDCAMDSGYVSARHSDDRRATTATTVSRIMQRDVVARIEHEHVRTLASGASATAFRKGSAGQREYFRRRGNQESPRFTPEELALWDKNLAVIDPGHTARLAHEWRGHGARRRKAA